MSQDNNAPPQDPAASRGQGIARQAGIGPGVPRCLHPIAGAGAALAGHTEAAPCVFEAGRKAFASPAEIRAQRAKLEATMTAVQKADCDLSSQSGH